MDRDRLVLRQHAGERMFERGISIDAVAFVVESGEVIEQYAPETRARLMLGYWEGRPLHVVCADDERTNEIYVITVYWPNPARWDAEFKRRI